MAARATKSRASSQVKTQPELPEIYENIRKRQGRVTVALFWTYIHDNPLVAQQRSLEKIVTGEEYLRRICQAVRKDENDLLQYEDLKEMIGKAKGLENCGFEESSSPSIEPAEELKSHSRVSISLVQEQQPILTQAITQIVQAPRPSLQPPVSSKKTKTAQSLPSRSIDLFKPHTETKTTPKPNYSSLGHGKDPDIAIEGLYMDVIRKPRTIELEEQIARRKQLDDYLKKKKKSGTQTNATKRKATKEKSSDAKLMGVYEVIAGKGKTLTLEQFGAYISKHSQFAQQLRVLEFSTREDFLPFLSQATGLPLSSPVPSAQFRPMLRSLRHYRPPTSPPVPTKPSHILLSDSLLEVLLGLFRFIDKDNEQYITREDFITAAAENEELQGSRNEVVYEVAEGAKTLGEVLQAIEDDGDELEYLSLSDLKDYLGYNYEEKQKNEELAKISLEKDGIRALYSAFQGSLKEGQADIADTEAFLASVRSRAEYSELRDKIAREPLGLSKFPKETVEELMVRIGQSEGETVAWNVVLAYLTVRGEPGLHEAQEEEGNGEERREESSWSSSSESSESQRSEVKSLNIEETLKLTVPDPPSFLSRPKIESITQRKTREMYEKDAQKEVAELQVRPKAVEVPASVSQPRYEQLRLQEEQRRMEGLRRTIAEEQAHSCPPKVAFKGLARPVPAPQSIAAFAAKPVPESSSRLLMEKMQAEEEMRRVRVHEQAKARLAEAQPPRITAAQAKPEPISHRKTVIKARSMPDFAPLQVRFQSQLEAKLQTKQVTTAAPFSLSVPRPCDDIPPVPAKPLTLSTLPAHKKKQAHKERIQQTVLNAMRSQSFADERSAHNVEAEQGFSKERNERVERFKADIESLSFKSR